MKMNILNKVGIAALATLTLASCSDSFLSDKKNYDNVNSGIYDTYEGCNGRINDIYSWCLPDPNSDANWKYNCTGNADEQSKSTEEYSGFTLFTNPDAEMMVQNGTSTVPDYFHNSSNNIQASVWGRIRNINDAIAGITNGSLDQDVKEEFLGQALFFRAWCYYQMVKWYGGVPIVKEVLEPDITNYTPRSSTKECIDFILDDLNTAAEYLSGTSYGDTEWGRITQASCLALKSRVLLLWASPIFNRSNDPTRWQNAYDQMQVDFRKINAAGYGLYTTGNNVNASDFAAVFSQTRCKEDLFVTLYNTVSAGDQQKNNNWERSIRPKNTTGSGLQPSSMIVDEFPMADGTLPESCDTWTLLPHSTAKYNATCPFLDRDPRFYRTFAFPGVRWAYSGDPTTQDSNNPSYDNGKNYILWNYTWYTSADEQGNPENGGYGADNLAKNVKGMYVRKRSDDLDVNSSPLYSGWAASANQSGFVYSAAPYVEIRYAEYLLNFAEAAAGAATDATAAVKLDSAKSLIKMVRERAGANTDVISNMAPTMDNKAMIMSAVLYERFVELAYEGKRFDDCRRWLLYDGGTKFSEIPNCPDTWILKGWDGNTCKWLGFKQLNDQRRDNMEFALRTDFDESKGIGTATLDGDPLVKYCKQNQIERADYSLDLTKPIVNEEGNQVQNLQMFYETFFDRKLRKGDAYDSNKAQEYIKFYPKYYLLGLGYGALSTDYNLEQTRGWRNPNTGGEYGTFDPLAQ